MVADSLPLEKMYIPVGASFSGVAWADAAIRQSRRINFGSVFIFSQPFTIQGDINAVTPTSVTLTNRVGSVTFPIP